MNGAPNSLPVLALLFGSAMLLEGCAIDPAEAPPSDKPVLLESRTHREHRLQSLWRGRTYQALLDAYGSPKMVMSLPSYRPVKTSVVVFGVIDKASDCIDSFTVVSQGQSEDMTVSDYYCR